MGRDIRIPGNSPGPTAWGGEMCRLRAGGSPRCLGNWRELGEDGVWGPVSTTLGTWK